MNTGSDRGVEAEHRIAADHPAFDGHFPGAPVLPGAHLLALVMQALAAEPALARRVGATPCVQQVKFLAPVGPGQRVQIRLDEAAAGGVAFAVRCGTTLVARGQFAAAGRPRAVTDAP